jgi:hypothetical protein
VLRGDARTVCDGVQTKLHFDSDDTDARNVHLARMAEASCFTIAALRQPVPGMLAVTVNGVQLDLTANGVSGRWSGVQTTAMTVFPKTWSPSKTGSAVLARVSCRDEALAPSRGTQQSQEDWMRGTECRA